MAEENGGVACSHGKFIMLKQEGNTKGNMPTKNEINIISDCQSGYMARIRRLKLKQSFLVRCWGGLSNIVDSTFEPFIQETRPEPDGATTSQKPGARDST